jgi:hypothetical protein
MHNAVGEALEAGKPVTEGTLDRVPTMLSGSEISDLSETHSTTA